MELTNRGPEGLARYNPARDIAYFSPVLLELTGSLLEPQRLQPWERKLLADAGCSWPAVVQAYVCLCNFMCAAAGDHNSRIMLKAIQESGFESCNPAAKILVLDRFARVNLGAWFDGIRNATMQGEEPPTCIRDLKKAGAQMEAALRGGVIPG